MRLRETFVLSFVFFVVKFFIFYHKGHNGLHKVLKVKG